MGDSKKWYTSKSILTLVAGIFVLIYRFVKDNYVPSLPLPPSNIVDLLVAALMGFGITGRVVASQKIQRSLLIVLLSIGITCGVARADIFGGRVAEKAKASKTANSEYRVSAAFVDPGTIIDYVSAIMGYLGTREGTFYDLDKKEFGNYIAATIYTISDTGISFNVGMLNTAGIGLTADWNVGSVIPSKEVPLLNLLQYLYIGGGVGYRNLSHGSEKSWETSPIADVQFKFTF